MPTLRDHVKKTLAARDPGPAAARADLEAVLARAERPRRPYWLAGPALAAAVLAFFFLRPVPKPPTAGVHLYLRVDGQAEDRALALDLTVKEPAR